MKIYGGQFEKKINNINECNTIIFFVLLCPSQRISENEHSKYITRRTHQKRSVGGAPQVHTPDSISEGKMVENFKEVLTS